jgi:hypothetical protein
MWFEFVRPDDLKQGASVRPDDPRQQASYKGAVAYPGPNDFLFLVLLG